MASVFSKIIAGEIPCHKIAETADFIAFLDITPIAKGHTLVVPKREVDYYFDLTNEELAGINAFAKEDDLRVFNARVSQKRLSRI